MANLTVFTRTMIEKGIEDQVYRSMAFTDELLRRNKIITRGGTAISKTVRYAKLDSLAQAYGSGDTLLGGEKTTAERPEFSWKKIQLPLEYDGDVEIQNLHAASPEKIIDASEELAEQGLEGLKLKFDSSLANGGSATTTNYNDTGKNIQSIVHALKHVSTTTENYGTKGRNLTTGVRNWWQGADQGAAPASQLVQTIAEGTGWTSYQNTATNLTIANLRRWTIPLRHSMRKPSDILWVMCTTLFNQLKAECQASMIYQGATDVANIGFQKMYIDGMNIADWSYLEQGSGSAPDNMKYWVLGLNMATWEIRISPARNFKMTPFKWAGELPNGQDKYLARLLLAGNCLCWRPSGNILLTQVS